MSHEMPTGPVRPARRSHAAIPVALIVVLIGIVLGRFSWILPLLLGFALLAAAGSLFSSRINPLSPHFYSDRKASWASVGVVFLGALTLFADTYYLWKDEVGGLLPHV